MTATSVVPPPMSTMSDPDGSLTGRPGADRGGHRLLDEAGPAGAGVERGVADGALLDLGHAGRDAEEHPRPGDHADPVVDLVDEVLDHLLGHVEVADDAVAQRPDRDDVGRRPADHPLGLGADRQDALGLGVDGDDRRLAHDDPAVADVDQRVGRPEVDPDVAGEDAEDPVEHGGGRVPSFVAVGGVGSGAAPAPGGAAGVGAGRAAASTRWVGPVARAVYPVALARPDGPPHGRLADGSAGRGPVERDAAVPQRHVRVVADDEVVEELDVQQAAGRQRLGGQVQVVR